MTIAAIFSRVPSLNGCDVRSPGPHRPEAQEGTRPVRQWKRIGNQGRPCDTANGAWFKAARISLLQLRGKVLAAPGQPDFHPPAAAAGRYGLGQFPQPWFKRWLIQQMHFEPGQYAKRPAPLRKRRRAAEGIDGNHGSSVPIERTFINFAREYNPQPAGRHLVKCWI
jgi:hypothetical protein